MIRIGNAPCSWGSLEFDGLEGEAIGYAQMLDELVETGYTGTELGDWGFMPTEAEALGEALSQRGLSMLGAFVPVALKDRGAHAAGIEEALRVARLLAAVAPCSPHGVQPYLVLADNNGAEAARTQHAGRVRPAMGLTEAAWDTFAEGAEALAKRVLEETGLRTVFHHHCAGYVETPEEIAALLDRTDPALLGLVFDTGHYAFGSGDPSAEGVMQGLDRFADRIWYVHFKDCSEEVAQAVREGEKDYFAAVAAGVFCELGKGCVDFGRVKEWLEKAGYDGYLCVEQDVLPGMGEPKESARRNREYLKALGL